jgi:hypothetical protein
MQIDPEQVLELARKMNRLSLCLLQEKVNASGLKRLRRDPKEPRHREKTELENELLAVMTRRFQRQLRKLRTRLGEYNPDRKAVQPPLDDIFDDEDMPEIIRLIFKGLLGGIDIFSEGVTFAVDWTLTNSRALEHATRYAFDLVRGIDSTSRDVISRAVGGFVETPGMTIGDVIEQLALGGFNEARAERVAVTEITRAYATGERMAAEELRRELPDVRMTKTWVTNNDDIVCDICGQNHMEEVDIDDTFPSGDSEPPGHVNCRCWIDYRTRING